MFGNFKRDALLRALNKYIKAGIHPMLQVLLFEQGPMSQYAVCLEGIKKKEDFAAFFMLPIDPSCPDIIGGLKRKFFKDDVFVLQNLLLTMHEISNIWKEHVKANTGLNLRFTVSGSLDDPFVPKLWKRGWSRSGEVTLGISVSTPAGVTVDRFWLRCGTPNKNSEYDLVSWVGAWQVQTMTHPIARSDHGTVFRRFIADCIKCRDERLVHCLELADAIQRADKNDLAVYLLKNASTYRATRREFL